MSNLKVNRDGSYEFDFKGEDLPLVVRFVKQNEIWRKEEAEKEAAKMQAKLEEAERAMACTCSAAHIGECPTDEIPPTELFARAFSS